MTSKARGSWDRQVLKTILREFFFDSKFGLSVLCVLILNLLLHFNYEIPGSPFRMKAWEIH